MAVDRNKTILYVDLVWKVVGRYKHENTIIYFLKGKKTETNNIRTVENIF